MKKLFYLLTLIFFFFFFKVTPKNIYVDWPEINDIGEMYSFCDGKKFCKNWWSRKILDGTLKLSKNNRTEDFAKVAAKVLNTYNGTSLTE